MRFANPARRLVSDHGSFDATLKSCAGTSVIVTLGGFFEVYLIPKLSRKLVFPVAVDTRFTPDDGGVALAPIGERFSGLTLLAGTNQCEEINDFLFF